MVEASDAGVRSHRSRPFALLAFWLAAACSSGHDDGEPSAGGKVTDDRPQSSTCVTATRLPNPSADVNNQPQAEVAIDVAPDGRLAAAAKDLRYGPPADPTYNQGVWNGLYLSGDAGATWENGLFEDQTPNTGLDTVTSGDFGRDSGRPVHLNRETDPAVAFDRDGNLYTCALAFGPGDGDPSAVVVTRRDRSGRLGPTRFLGLEADSDLFDDKNWIAVDRDAPVESTIVVASWKLFGGGADLNGGTIAVSADGAQSFGAPIHLPVEASENQNAQFFQPLIGPDPATGRKTLFVVYSVFDETTVTMGLVKAPLDGLAPGTSPLHARLADPKSWTPLPRRVVGLRSHGGSGFDGTFRFTSFFYPAIDRQSGRLFAVVPVLQPGHGARVMALQSADGGATWSQPRAIDDPAAGHQLMAAAAADSGLLSVLWYDTRADSQFTPSGAIHALDVYYAELDPTLGTRRVLRLTAETEAADRPVFTVLGQQREKLSERPALSSPERPPEQEARTESQVCEPYGFIGDYIGLAADRDNAYAAWCDLRDVRGTRDICQGGTCDGRRNENIYFARIPKAGG
jgi:hypothetical protein